MAKKQKIDPNFKPYRPRKQIVEELETKGIINEFEAKQLNNAVDVADKAKLRGKYFLDLSKYVGAQKKELQEAIDKGKLNENQKRLLHTLQVHQIEKPLISSALSIDVAIQKYFDITLQGGNKPTINGLSLALGITKKDLFDLVNGKRVFIGGIELKGKEAITKAVQVIATANELDIANSGGVGAEFLGKNFFGLSDKQEITIHDNKDDLTEKEIDDKYKDIDVIDV